MLRKAIPSKTLYAMREWRNVTKLADCARLKGYLSTQKTNQYARVAELADAHV